MASLSSSAPLAQKLGQLLLDGFFDKHSDLCSFDFDRFFKQCVEYYHLMRDNPERTFPKIIEKRWDAIVDHIILRGTVMNAMPFMNQTTDIVTDPNPHFARMLRNTTHIRSAPMQFIAKQVRFEGKSTAPLDPILPHAGYPVEPSNALPVPKLNLPAHQRRDSGLKGNDPSSTIQGQKSRSSNQLASSSNVIHVEHPSAEILWLQLTDAVRAACTLSPKYRRVSTTMDQCLRDVMLAERIPAQLLKILPEQSEAMLITEGSNLAQQVLNELDLQAEEDASNCPRHIMAILRDNLPGHCASLHLNIADNVLLQTLARGGGVLGLIWRDETHIEEIIYVWLNLTITVHMYTAATREDQQFFRDISEGVKRSAVPLLLLGSCRQDLTMTARNSFDRLHACLDYFLKHKEETLAPEGILLPRDWTDKALRNLAFGVSRYAVYMRCVAQQAAVNLQHDGDSDINMQRDGDSESHDDSEGAWTEGAR